MFYIPKSSIVAAILVALYFVSSAFGQALKPIQAGDFFSVSPGNEIWRLPAGDTGGIGEMYTRPPSGGSLWGVASDKDRNLYYIYEMNPSHVLARVTAAGVVETLVTMPLSGTQYFVEDFTASESGTVYIVFRARSISDAWVVRIGSDRKAIDHRSGQEVRGPFTSQSFPAGIYGRLAVSSSDEVYIVTRNIGTAASGTTLNRAPAGGALQLQGTVTDVRDIEFSDGQLWGARGDGIVASSELVKITLSPFAIESKGTFAAYPILKRGSIIKIGEGRAFKIAEDTFTATTLTWREFRRIPPRNFTAVAEKKKECPPITVTTKGNLTGSLSYYIIDILSFAASGGTPPYTYVGSGQLPPDSQIVPRAQNTATLFGELTRRGIYRFSVKATDSKGCTGSTEVVFEVKCPRPYLIPLPDAYVGQDYSEPVFMNNDKVRIVGGSLPPGLTDSPSKGGLEVLTVSGKPTRPGVYFYTLEVTNARDPECKFRQTFRMIVGNSPSDENESEIGPKEAESIYTLGGETPKALNALIEVPEQQNSPLGRLALEGSNELYATAVISYRQNGVIVSEAAIPVSPPTTRSRIFIDYGSSVRSGTGTVDVYTGLATVNRGSASARITLRLRDAPGALLASGTATLATGAHVAKFIHQISELAPDFVLPAGFATSTRFATLELESDQPLSVLALRLTINQRGDLLLTSTPAADLTQPAQQGTLYFPQLADGGGWRTAIIGLNTSTVIQRGVVRILDDGGAPLAVKMDSGESGSEIRYSIEPGGFVRLATDGSPAAVRTGSVQLVPDGGGTAPAGAGVFSLIQGGIVTTESGIPATLATTRARIYVDKSAGHDTGIAVAATGPTPVEIRLEAFGSDSAVPVATGRLTLAGNGHAGKFAGDLVTGGLPADFTGVLEISAPASFAALTLRSLVNERGDFLVTTFPVADLTRAAPSPMVFPQVVAGGGYGAEFVMLNAGASEKRAVIRFFDEKGSPIAVSTLVVRTASGAP